MIRVTSFVEPPNVLRGAAYHTLVTGAVALLYANIGGVPPSYAALVSAAIDEERDDEIGFNQLFRGLSEEATYRLAAVCLLHALTAPANKIAKHPGTFIDGPGWYISPACLIAFAAKVDWKWIRLLIIEYLTSVYSHSPDLLVNPPVSLLLTALPLREDDELWNVMEYAYRRSPDLMIRMSLSAGRFDKTSVTMLRSRSSSLGDVAELFMRHHSNQVAVRVDQRPDDPKLIALCRKHAVRRQEHLVSGQLYIMVRSTFAARTSSIDIIQLHRHRRLNFQVTAVAYRPYPASAHEPFQSTRVTLNGCHPGSMQYRSCVATLIFRYTPELVRALALCTLLHAQCVTPAMMDIWNREWI